MSTRAWVVATVLTLGVAMGAEAQIADRMSRSRASSGAAQRSTQGRAQAQSRASGSASTQGRATTRSAPSQSVGRAQAQSRASGSSASREREVRAAPPQSRAGGVGTARGTERSAQARVGGQTNRQEASQGRIDDPARNRATRAVPGVASGQSDAERNRATRVVPGRATGPAPRSSVSRGYATGVNLGWDWDRNRDRRWYYERDRNWYRYWERDRLWNWRVGPIPGWWVGFRWAPRGLNFGWHVNLFWNSWDNHYGWRNDHGWLHERLDRIHEEWHLRHGWRGYSEGWYGAHEALHNRLEREHDRWYRSYDAYAWPWDGPEVWLQWGIPDPWEFDDGYGYSDHGWQRQP